MFEKFGEFNSVEELNKAAEGLLAEGDKQSLYVLAEENGIDKEDVQDYIDGTISELGTVFSAAFGRIKVERKDVSENHKKESGNHEVIFNALEAMCTDEVVAKAVVKKGKRAKKILEEMEKVAKSKGGNMAVVCGTDRDLSEIIKLYYTESDKVFKERLKTQCR